LLILVLDLITAFLPADLTCTQHRRLVRLPAICRIFAREALIQNQIGSWCGTNIKVLVQPKSFAGTRKIKTAFFPIATYPRFAAALGQHVTFALENVKMRPRPVPVAFLIVTRLEARDMGLHHAGAHHHEGVGTAAAAALPLV